MARVRKRSKAGWMKANNKVVGNKINDFFDKATEALLKEIYKVAEDVMEYIDSQKVIPIYTGNLKDATGIGVYNECKLVKYVPSKIATRPQSSGFHFDEGDSGERKYTHLEIWGHKYLSDALEAASKDEYSNGIWIVLFSAVPYAFFIEARDRYFSDIRDVMLNKILKKYY